MDVILFQYLGAGIGVASVAALSFKPKYIIPAMYLHIISCVVMGVYAYFTGQVGIYVSQVVYLVLDVVAIVNWTRHHKQALDKVLT